MVVLVAATIVAGAGFALSNSQANSGVSSTSSVLITTTRTITETANVSATQMPTSTGSCGIILGTGGPVYLKVSSDDGSPITNGSVLVAHYGPTVNGVSCGVKTYRVGLKPLANGYTIVSINDSLPLAGNYNLTLFAGYGGGKTFTSHPPVAAIRPTTPVYITVMVPSGLIVLSDCINGSCPTTTMKTASGG
jgi:hypothetical protein